MRFFPLFFRFVHRNCPIFGTKVNIDNTYLLEIFYPLRPPPSKGVGVWGVTQIFYRSPAFRICTGCLPKYEWNLLKIGFKNTYFQVFAGISSPYRLLHPSSQMANFDQFLAKTAKTVKIVKKALGTFFSRLQALTNCKVSEKIHERFSRKRVTDERTNGRTDARTDATPKVSTTSWSRDQKEEDREWSLVECHKLF